MQKNAAEAYTQTAKVAAAPREREAELLIKAAIQLQNVKDADTQDRTALYQALIYNRKLWSVFVASVAEPDNPLPQDIKNNIASLGMFIFNQTIEVQENPEPEKLNSLININREIAAGLRQQAA